MDIFFIYIFFYCYKMTMLNSRVAYLYFCKTVTLKKRVKKRVKKDYVFFIFIFNNYVFIITLPKQTVFVLFLFLT